MNTKLDWVGQQNGETSKENNTGKINCLATNLIDVCKLLSRVGVIPYHANNGRFRELHTILKDTIPQNIMNVTGVVRNEKEYKYWSQPGDGGPTGSYQSVTW
jgi:hypothetical protein